MFRRFAMFWVLVAMCSFTQPVFAATPDASVVNAVTSYLTTRDGLISDGKTQSHVSPTAVVGNYAIADFLWGEFGGRAVLQFVNGNWSVLEAAGGTFGSSHLVRLGVPSDVATQLIEQLQSQEPGG